MHQDMQSYNYLIRVCTFIKPTSVCHLLHHSVHFLLFEQILVCSMRRLFLTNFLQKTKKPKNVIPEQNFSRNRGAAGNMKLSGLFEVLNAVASLHLARRGRGSRALGEPGDSSLHLACRAEKYRKVKSILGEQDTYSLFLNDQGETPLHIIATNGNVKIMNALLADPNGLEFVDQPDINEETALMMACANGHLEVVKVLLEAGADINYVCPGGMIGISGSTALGSACTEGQVQVVRYLFENGIVAMDTCMPSGVLESPLQMAAVSDKDTSAVEEYLLRIGYQADDMYDGKTALTLAYSSGHPSNSIPFLPGSALSCIPHLATYDSISQLAGQMPAFGREVLRAAFVRTLIVAFGPGSDLSGALVKVPELRHYIMAILGVLVENDVRRLIHDPKDKTTRG